MNKTNWASHDLYAWEDWTDITERAKGIGIEQKVIDQIRPDLSAHFPEVERAIMVLEEMCHCIENLQGN